MILFIAYAKNETKVRRNTFIYMNLNTSHGCSENMPEIVKSGDKLFHFPTKLNKITLKFEFNIFIAIFGGWLFPPRCFCKKEFKISN